MIEIVPAQRHHIGPIATRMRLPDLMECWAFGFTPKTALRTLVASATQAWTVKVDGRPEVMLGVNPYSLLEGVGTPWMLGTQAGFRHRRRLLEDGVWFVEQMHKNFARLENNVAARNRGAIRLLEKLGFDVGGEPQEIGGMQFLPFRRTRNVF